MLSPPPYLLAFGFANAAVLGWLAAAAAPILIHLWMKRVHRETPWAAVRFLQAAVKRHSRRLRLQEWLLLAIRTAIILLVVLAASKPVLETLGGLLGPGVRTHRVLVIDASMSMRYQHEDGVTLLDRAKRLAKEVVEGAGPGDQFSLCLMTGKPSAPVASATVDAAAVLAAIDATGPTDTASDLPATLAVVEAVVSAAADGPSPADRREVVFLSDLTRSAWEPLTASGEGAAAAPLLGELAGRAALSLIDVGVASAPNAAVIDARVTSGAPTLREPVRVAGRVQAFGAGSSEARVELV
ncbi:MAG: BatA domain-containing protein, partial [Planctomycetota bacterium]